MFNDDAEVEAVRESRGQAALAEQKMALAQGGADVVEKGSKVDLNVAKAQEASK